MTILSKRILADAAWTREQLESLREYAQRAQMMTMTAQTRQETINELRQAIVEAQGAGYTWAVEYDV